MIFRKMRIAADIAHGWARNFKLGDALAKSVLTATTLYVNDQGSCYVGIATLADDTELSQNTVRRKLAWLEDIRAIERVPQWLDEHGRRTSDRLRGGKCTSDEIRLCLDVDPAEIEARAHSRFEALADMASPPTKVWLADQSNPSSVGGLNPVSPPLALQQPSQSREGLNLFNKELEQDSLLSGERGRELARITVPVCANKAEMRRPAELPEDWMPSVADLEAVGSEGLSDETLRRETTKFKDYWPNAPAGRRRKADWSATWRNWIRKAADDLNNRPHGMTHGTHRNGPGGFALNAIEFARRAADNGK
jgi:hypothetical protein